MWSTSFSYLSLQRTIYDLLLQWASNNNKQYLPNFSGAPRFLSVAFTPRTESLFLHVSERQIIVSKPVPNSSKLLMLSWGYGSPYMVVYHIIIVSLLTKWKKHALFRSHSLSTLSQQILPVVIEKYIMFIIHAWEVYEWDDRHVKEFLTGDKN